MKAAINTSRLQFHPATSGRWADVEDLFGERGACGGCWCMYWRLRRTDWASGKGNKNKTAFRKLITAGRQPGVIAYNGKEPIGWCAIAPREEYLSLAKSRVLKPLDDKRVWSITCLFVKKGFRRQGISIELLRAAVRFAARQGARVIEGYPTVPKMEKTPDPFVYMGVPSAFKAAGFKEAARRSPNRPIMRLQINSR